MCVDTKYKTMDLSLYSHHHFNGLEYDSDYIYSRKLRESQSEAVEQAMSNLGSCLVVCTETLELADVKNSLEERGVPESSLDHLKNTIIDRLELRHKGCLIELSIPLFPKRNYRRGCKIEVKSHEFTHNIETNNTPDSIAEFVLKIVEWLPEYETIEEKLKQKVEQEKLAAQIAFDLLKKVAGRILDEKGYGYQIFKNNSSNKASLIINTSKAISTDLEVRLLDNFYDDIVKHLEAMPYFESK
jgi:hypothetical protein